MIEVRPAAPDDAEAIAQMARELARAVDDPPPKLDGAGLAQHLFSPEPWGEALVAEAHGRLCGYALVCRSFEAHTGQKRLWLADLFVDPETRAAGVGRALMAAVARRAVELECEAVYWDLWTENAAGGAFYRRLEAELVDDLIQFRLAGERLARLAG
jgi:GNAT superfamily N-acetyltransferase